MGYKFDKKMHVHTLNGKPLIGVTSALKYWGDPGPLLNWGVKTAVDAIEAGATPEEARKAHTQKRDKAGDRGTEVHARLEECMNEWIETGWFSVKDSSADDTVLSVMNWMIDQKITPLASEMNVWSEKHWYGGIADGVIEKEGKKYILDFKTSNTIQTKYFYQMGAYSLAVKEMKEHAQVDGVVIVHIPKGQSFNPEKNVYWEYDMPKLEQAWLNILNAYKADQSLQKKLYPPKKSSFKI